MFFPHSCVLKLTAVLVLLSQTCWGRVKNHVTPHRQRSAVAAVPGPAELPSLGHELRTKLLEVMLSGEGLSTCVEIIHTTTCRSKEQQGVVQQDLDILLLELEHLSIKKSEVRTVVRHTALLINSARKEASATALAAANDATMAASAAATQATAAASAASATAVMTALAAVKQAERRASERAAKAQETAREVANKAMSAAQKAADEAADKTESLFTKLAGFKQRTEATHVAADNVKQQVDEVKKLMDTNAAEKLTRAVAFDAAGASSVAEGS